MGTARAVVTASLLAVLVASGTGACAGSDDEAGDSGGGAPSTAVSGNAVSVDPDGGVPACAASDLDLSAGDVGAFHGESQNVQVRNLSDSKCRVPLLVGARFDSPAVRVAVDTRSLAAMSIELPPNRRAYLLVNAGACLDPGPVARTITLRFRGLPPREVPGMALHPGCHRPSVIDLYRSGPPG